MEGGAHIPGILGTLSVQGKGGEHASPQRADSGQWLWGLSQLGRTPERGRERRPVAQLHPRKKEKWGGTQVCISIWCNCEGNLCVCVCEC